MIRILTAMMLVGVAGVVAFGWLDGRETGSGSLPAVAQVKRATPFRYPPAPVQRSSPLRSPVPVNVTVPAIVRVCLTPTAVRSLELAIDGPYQIRSLDRGDILASGDKLAATRVSVTHDAFQIGHEVLRGTSIEIEARQPPAIWIGDHQYRGRVRLYRQSNDRVLAVNHVSMDDYIATVVDSEMPAKFPVAARQAQAVAARTYVMSRMKEAEGALFDVYATTRSQRYLGFQYRNAAGRRLAGETEAGRQIAQQTKNFVCTYRGQIFSTYYCAVCGGRTTLGTEVFADAAPPLQSVPCDWCRDADRYSWSKEFDRTTVSDWLEQYFRRSGKPFGTLVSLTPLDGRPGLTAQFLASDGRRRYDLSALELRDLFPASALASTRFTVRETRETLILEGTGHGHGVGMCQWGARGMALAGKSYGEILRHYYPGCDVVVLKSDGASR